MFNSQTKVSQTAPSSNYFQTKMLARPSPQYLQETDTCFEWCFDSFGTLPQSAVLLSLLLSANLIKIPVWDGITSARCILACLLRAISAGTVIRMLKNYHMALASFLTHTCFGKTACVTTRHLFLIKKHD